ncbi:MAG: glutathione S-transferase C-terminal domain-containing protein [Acidobacteriota bacterium]
MGMLVNGEWVSEDAVRTGKHGEFLRPVSPYRDWIGADDGRFPAEPGRYHLFANPGCPWAYRTILYRKLKGLEGILGLSLTQAAAGQEGWTFGETTEPILGARHMHDVYTAADPTFTGRCTVPVLWDLRSGTIVNNESADIIRMFDRAFEDPSAAGRERYYRAEKAAEIDSLNAEIYEAVNNGVYRCGFASSQAAYEQAYDALFETLDRLDELLASRRYLCGDAITEADWRLFATLVRFDLAYYAQFRCNRQRLTDYAELWPYTRDLYQQPGVAETVDVQAIKGIYFGSRPPGILPKGPDLDFSEPHGRGRFG